MPWRNIRVENRSGRCPDARTQPLSWYGQTQERDGAYPTATRSREWSSGMGRTHVREPTTALRMRRTRKRAATGGWVSRPEVAARAVCMRGTEQQPPLGHRPAPDSVDPLLCPISRVRWVETNGAAAVRNAVPPVRTPRTGSRWNRTRRARRRTAAPLPDCAARPGNRGRDDGEHRAAPNQLHKFAMHSHPPAAAGAAHDRRERAPGQPKRASRAGRERVRTYGASSPSRTARRSRSWRRRVQRHTWCDLPVGVEKRVSTDKVAKSKIVQVEHVLTSAAAEVEDALARAHTCRPRPACAPPLASPQIKLGIGADRGPAEWVLQGRVRKSTAGRVETVIVRPVVAG